MLYLIVKCEELNDGWECDADRTPIAITKDWQEWARKNKPKYPFEVWRTYDIEGRFTLIKEY